MEILVGVGIGVLIALVAGVRKKRQKQPPARSTETPEERRRREDNELIAVILPTIDHDK